MAPPGKNTNMAHWRIVFPFTTVTFLLYCIFFMGFLSSATLDRETFDHTMCEVNIKENATILLQTAQRVDESCQQRS